ncbi:MAG TPA: helix-turn-helix domain-containing protein [Nocardioidaceae bacterium]|nr:helix-turn-helix domain-containing protein [Nocardioidaceae bacterium]
MNETQRLGVPDPAERATLTVWPETAAILGLSKASAYDAARRGEIPTIRVGRRLLVPTAALRRMLQLDNPEPVT